MPSDGSERHHNADSWSKLPSDASQLPCNDGRDWPGTNRPRPRYRTIDEIPMSNHIYHNVLNLNETYKYLYLYRRSNIYNHIISLIMFIIKYAMFIQIETQLILKRKLVLRKTRPVCVPTITKPLISLLFGKMAHAA